MKKSFLILTMLSFVLLAQAQSYDEIKQSVLLNQYKKAKEDVDKRMTNAKFASKAEAFLLKATIYGALASDSATPKATAVQYQAEAETAFAKFKEMEPGMESLKDPVYKNAPIYLYSNLFAQGREYMDAKQWPEAHTKFKKVSEYSSLLASQGMLNSPLDTTIILFVGFTAEQAGNKEEAAKYYKILADAKVKEGYENVYSFLVIYNFEKNDLANFEKYKKMGQELFPKNDFFNNDQTDFAVGLKDDFGARLKSLEDVLKATPNDYKSNFMLGKLIFDTLYSEKEGAVPPANAAELEAKMIASFTKATETQPDSDIAFLYLGDHFIQQSNKVNEEKEKLEADVKKRTKPGTKPTKEDAAKIDALDKKYGDLYENTRIQYEKAAGIYAKKGTLTANEKQQYRNVAGFLGDIYTYKREKAEKAKSPDVNKLLAEEKKWNDLYGSIGR